MIFLENLFFMTKKEKEKLLKKIKIAMTESGTTQTELAKKLGLTQAAVSAWFNGKGTPGIDTITRVADVLKKPVNYFFADVQGNNIAVGHGAKTSTTNDATIKVLSAQVEMLLAKVKLLEHKVEHLEKMNTPYPFGHEQ